LTHLRPALFLAAGIGLALAGFFAIKFSCPYGLVATVMTGQILIPVPGDWLVLPYKRVLSGAVFLVLYALYLWARGYADRNGLAKQARTSLSIAFVGVGVALIGFLSVLYPCPVPISLGMLMQMDIWIGDFSVPYWWVLGLAACILLYAAYGWMKKSQPARA
jgi:hypothetical protein